MSDSWLTYQLKDLSGSLEFIVPELILAGVFLLMIVLELIFGKKNDKIVPITGIVGLLVALLAVGMSEAFGKVHFLGMIRIDGISLFFRYLFGLTGALTIGVSMASSGLKTESKGRGEYYIVVVAMVLGMNLMSMASNLVMMYLALELVSISSYVLTAYTRMSRPSAEASLKYLIYGAFSSGIMIYGISWFYGLTGNLDPHFGFMEQPDFILILVACIMILGGFLFKVSALPFHFWAPDVYEGAPYPVAAFFSVAPKAAGFVLMIHFLESVITKVIPDLGGEEVFMHVLAVIAMATMTLGNLSAIRQKTFRRMLAFSSVAHAGYILMGVLCMNAYGNAAVMYYLLVYACMNLAAFWIAGWIEENWGISEIDKLSGTAKKNPALAVILTALMIALTGLPPTTGLTGKFYLFSAVLGRYQTDGHFILILLMVFAVVNTVVSLFFYLRVPMKMIFGKAEEGIEPQKLPMPRLVLAGILTLPVVVLGMWGFDKVFNLLLELASP